MAQIPPSVVLKIVVMMINKKNIRLKCSLSSLQFAFAFLKTASCLDIYYWYWIFWLGSLWVPRWFRLTAKQLVFRVLVCILVLLSPGLCFYLANFLSFFSYFDGDVGQLVPLLCGRFFGWLLFLSVWRVFLLAFWVVFLFFLCCQHTFIY